MNPDDLKRAATIIVSRELVFDEEAALAARLRAAAERTGEAVAWRRMEFGEWHYAESEFYDSEPLYLHPAPPIPQGVREVRDKRACQKCGASHWRVYSSLNGPYCSACGTDRPNTAPPIPQGVREAFEEWWLMLSKVPYMDKKFVADTAWQAALAWAQGGKP